MGVYEPREDSELIRKHVNEFARGSVLDMGTGSGILAEEAAKRADLVIGVDINPEAIGYCKKNIHNDKIMFYHSDLFQIFELGKIKRKFDLIIFNPPYLPDDEFTDVSTGGGRKGHELTARFLRTAKDHLEKNGKILLLFSSLTGKNRIDGLLEDLDYEHKLVDEKRFNWEALYVYLIWRK